MSHDDRDNYWKPAPTRGPDDLAREKPYENVWHLFVCDTCRVAFGHPLSYCPSCPGKMVWVKGGSYKDFVAERPGYKWGEDAVWDERWRLFKRLEEAEKAGGPIPCVVTTWPSVYAGDRQWFRKKCDPPEVQDGPIVYEKLIPRLVEELGVEAIRVRELAEYPNRVEVKFGFSSFAEFDKWRLEKKGRGMTYRLDPSSDSE